MGPLEGLKVVDFTRFVAGPFCVMQLADLGADVVKIESPPERGDQLRAWGPFIGDKSYYFITLNKNKRSIALDLKSPQGIEIVKEMIRGGGYSGGKLPSRTNGQDGSFLERSSYT